MLRPASIPRFSPRFLSSHASLSASSKLCAAKPYSRGPVTPPARMSSGTAAPVLNPKTARIGNPALLITTASKLLRAAKPLNIPIYITTQNRARLGTTVSELGPYIDPATNPNVRADLDKTLFSMVTPELKAQFPAQPLDAIIVGIESHICIMQTTLDLLALGHRVYVVADGVSSVNPEERVVALARLRDAGAIVTTSESLLFEIMGDAKHVVFKQVSGLVKETGDETKKALGVFCGSKI
ncbi:isochorismatase family hydrolase [Histoplasma capsulatum]|uniref:Isochorismatase family hydrolase n=2 Tax=Histoplasma TaxID=5036 RepID=A0A8A1MDQ0_AJECA|nr:isochorismatase family hydrolase [Histoplasma capsulatum]